MMSEGLAHAHILRLGEYASEFMGHDLLRALAFYYFASHFFRIATHITIRGIYLLLGNRSSRGLSEW